MGRYTYSTGLNPTHYVYHYQSADITSRTEYNTKLIHLEIVVGGFRNRWDLHA